MVTLAAALLGDTIYLFNEQYVVKAAERGMSFGWHQDSGFIDYPHRPYLTCWITLDEVTEEPILSADGTGPRHLARPLLIDGNRVAGP